MQEEIEQKSFNIMISTTKLSARTVLRAVKAAFRLYVTHSGEGEGLLFFGNVILPFVDRFPTDLELYRIMTTKLGEVSEGQK